MLTETMRGIWNKGKNHFEKLNTDDMSVAAKWPVIHTNDVITTGLTAVVSPLSTSNTGVNGIAGDTSNALHGVAPVVGLAAELYEFVVYARKGNKDWLYLEDHTVTNAYAYFNISSGVLGTVGVTAIAEINDEGNGWYRCAIRFLGTGAAHTLYISPAHADADNDFAGDAATVNTYIWAPACYSLKPNLPGSGGGLRMDDLGDLIVGGIDEKGRAAPLTIARADYTHSAATPVVAVQVLDITGSPSMALGAVSAANGATAPTSSLQVGGKASDGKMYPVLVGTDGRLYCALQSAGTPGATAPTIANMVGGKDGAGNLQALLIGTDGRADVNLGQVGGTTVAFGAGNLSNGVQRVTLCADGLVGTVTATPGSAVPTKTFQVSGSDGTNARTVKTDSAGVVYNQPAVVPSFEDAANSRARVSIENHKAFTMSPQITASVTTGTTILSATVIAGLQNARLWIFNSSAAALTACTVTIANYAGRSYTLDSATFMNLGATTTLSLLLPAGLYSVSVTASSSGTSATEVEITGNY
jgi:hypothetical protein